jgi:UrcA family protein
MSQFTTKCVLAGALMISLMSGAALAQPASLSAPLPPDSDLSGLTIVAPKTIDRTRYGVVTQEMSMSVSVSYADLDMRTPSGVAELDRRVNEAATLICSRLEIAYPNGSPERFFCVKRAVGDAGPQVIKARNEG